MSYPSKRIRSLQKSGHQKLGLFKNQLPRNFCKKSCSNMPSNIYDYTYFTQLQVF